MSYVYQPISGDQIRLLTLEPLPAKGEDAPIKCSLEIVSLSELSQVPSGQRFKGDDYLWPEIHAPCDTTTLFRRHPDPSAPPKGFSTALTSSPQTSDLSTEAHLPWRHSWGDYIALSYTWGPPEPRRTIYLDGHPFSATSHLYDALLFLRRSQRVRQGFKLWIDAICICQDDIAERGRQVVHMRDIYASAWQVVSYIGAETDDSEIAMTALRWMGSRVDEAANPLEGFYRKPFSVEAPILGTMSLSWSSIFRGIVYKAIFGFLTRPYWRRMWILQEAAMAREDAPIVCGNTCLTWRQVCSAVAFISLDEGRFDREIITRSRPKEAQHGAYEFARGRLVGEEEYSSERTWGLLSDIQELRSAQSQTADKEALMDFLQLLQLARKSDATDDKDRVYGLLGLRMVSERLVIVPDYTQSLPAIYQNFSQHLLLEGDLNVLRLVSRHCGSIYRHWNFGNSFFVAGTPIINAVMDPIRRRITKEPLERSVGEQCCHDLPSWAVCWACKPPPTAHLPGSYRAGGTLSPRPVLISGPQLHVQGVFIDAINSLGSFHSREVDASYPLNAHPTPTSVYGDLDATRTAFWRTVSGNSTANGTTPAPETYSCLLYSWLWNSISIEVESNGFAFHEIMARNKSLVLSGYTLENLVFGKKEEEEEEGGRASRKSKRRLLTEQQLEALSWAMNVLAWRRLAGTKAGRMGLAAAGANIGDTIAVLAGCDVPMILRRHGSGKGWVVVGECYVHGVMDGEAVEGCGERMEDIIIH